jgi:magnesium transporter
MSATPQVQPESGLSDEAMSAIINCAAYSGGKRVGEVAVGQIDEVLGEGGKFVWLGLLEPGEELLKEVQKRFALHDLAIEDAHTAHQRPKLEQYGDAIFVVLRTAHLAADCHVEFGETHVFVGRRYVVTVRHGSLKSHVGLRARCEASPQLLTKGPGYVLYALMDFVVDQYFPIAHALEEEIEALEEQIFGKVFDRDITRRIYTLKGDLLALKRAVSPLVDVCNRLMRFEGDLIPDDTRVYFRDVYDHVVKINEMIDTQRELLNTALEANLSLIAVAQNDEIKRLAAWAAIIAVPTMIAGIYGMNFVHMPELNAKWGYPMSLSLMGIVCGALYYRFKHAGWL